MPRNVTLTYSDGTQHQYANVPDDATPESVHARGLQDFPDKTISGIDGGQSSDPANPDHPHPSAEQLHAAHAQSGNYLPDLQNKLKNKPLDTAEAAFGSAPQALVDRFKQVTSGISEQDIQAHRMIAASHPVAGFVGSVATFLPTAMIPGVNGAVGTVLSGAAAGALEPTLKDESTIGNAVGGALTSFGFKTVAAPVAKELFQAIIPRLSATQTALVQKAASMGFTLTHDMITNSKLVKTIGQAFRGIPLAGSPNAANKLAVEKNLLVQIGDNTSTKFTPEAYQDALSKSGNIIGEIGSQYQIKATPKFLNTLDSMATDKKRGADAMGVLSGWVDDIKQRVEGGNTIEGAGEIDGKTFAKIRSELGAEIRGKKFDDPIKSHLLELQNFLLDNVRSNLSATESKLFDAARVHYAKAISLAPIVSDLETGKLTDIPAIRLATTVSNTANRKLLIAKGAGGDLPDIARMANMTGADSAQARKIAYGGGGGAAIASLGSLAIPAAAPVAPYAGGIAALLYGGANLYNRASPSVLNLMENPSLVSPYVDKAVHGIGMATASKASLPQIDYTGGR